MGVLMSTNWANKGKQAASNVKLATNNGQAQATRYTGTIDSAIPVVFKTGSFGVKIKYIVANLERAVYENIVLSKLNDDGMPTPTQYGESTLKRRFLAAGLSADEINALKTPRSPKDTASLEPLAGAQVALGLVDRQYIRDNGQPAMSKDVKYVYPLDANGGEPQAA